MSTNTTQISRTALNIIILVGSLLFFALILIAPFVNSSIYATEYTTTKIILTYLSGLASCFLLLFIFPKVSHSYTNSLPKFVKPLFVVIFISLLASIIFAISPSIAIFGAFKSWENNLLIYTCFALIFTAWYIYFHVLSVLKLHHIVFSTLISISIIITVIYGLGEYYLWQPSANYVSMSVHRINLGFRNPLYAGYFIGMLWSFQFIQTLLELLKSDRKVDNFFKSLWSVLLFFGISFALILTFTRSAWIACAIAGVAVFAILFAKTAQKLKLLISLLIISIPIFLLTFSFRTQIQKRNADIYSDTKIVADSLNTLLSATPNSTAVIPDFYQKYSNYTSAQLRLIEWKWGLKTWTGNLKNFLIGTGPDNAFLELTKFREKELNNIPEDFAIRPYYIRSLYIFGLVEHGVIFVLCSFGLLLWIFIRYLRSKKFSLTTLPALAIVLSLFTQGIFYYPTVIVVVLTIFALSFMFAEHTDTTQISLREPTNLERVLITLISIVIFTWSILITRVEGIVKLYRLAIGPVDTVKMQNNTSIPFNDNILIRYYVSKNNFEPLVIYYLDKLSTSNDLDDLWVAADVYYKLARETDSKELLDKSSLALQKAIQNNPTQPTLYDSLGLRYLFDGNFSEARTQFNKAIELKEDYWFAYMHLGEVSRQECRPKEALDWYAKAELYIPTANAEISEAKLEIKSPRPECIGKKVE